MSMVMKLKLVVKYITKRKERGRTINYIYIFNLLPICKLMKQELFGSQAYTISWVKEKTKLHLAT